MDTLGVRVALCGASNRSTKIVEADFTASDWLAEELRAAGGVPRNCGSGTEDDEECVVEAGSEG